MHGGEEELAAWVGRTREERDVLTAFPARGMAALLDRDPGAFTDGATLPLGWHWMYFRPAVPRGRLGPDGHEARGEFLPPVPLERRMWAGGRLRLVDRLALGEPAAKRSTVAAVTEKVGRSGPLAFVTVRHEITGPRGLAVEEEQELVYRAAGAAGATGATGTPRSGPAPPEDAVWTDSFTPGPVELFRFSALTFNGHRIHYDHTYATEAEGYPGLVVHGPLLALLLLDAAARHSGTPPEAFEYRAVAPAFVGEEVRLSGRTEGGVQRLWAWVAARGVVMSATAR